jgi:hypothetical protein
MTGKPRGTRILALPERTYGKVVDRSRQRASTSGDLLAQHPSAGRDWSAVAIRTPTRLRPKHLLVRSVFDYYAFEAAHSLARGHHGNSIDLCFVGFGVRFDRRLRQDEHQYSNVDWLSDASWRGRAGRDATWIRRKEAATSWGMCADDGHSGWSTAAGAV